MVRRSRGYAPAPLRLVQAAPEHILAVGAELKNTVAVAKGDLVVASHHIGDLEHLATYQSFLQAVDHLSHLYAVTPDVVAHDLHPEYLSTKFALDLGLPTFEVQHHHAHMASCLAEHGHPGPVLGLVFDGLGMGPTASCGAASSWSPTSTGYRRVGHLLPAALPGGSSAIREPWRMAVSWVYRGLGPRGRGPVGRRLDERWAAVLSLVEAGPGGRQPRSAACRRPPAWAGCSMPWLLSSGCARRVTYEGQAAIELEALARRVPRVDAPRYPVELRRTDGMLILDPGPLIAAVVAEVDPTAWPAEVVGQRLPRGRRTGRRGRRRRAGSRRRARHGGPLRRGVPERPVDRDRHR